jgi:hypothetical protein
MPAKKLPDADLEDEAAVDVHPAYASDGGHLNPAYPVGVYVGEDVERAWVGEHEYVVEDGRIVKPL